MSGRNAGDNWFERRTGVFAMLRAFLEDKIPSSTGWRNTLGSLSGAFLLVQILTGILLAVYYVPHPDAAYVSVEYVEEQVTGGALVRALHYWGASFAIVALVLHSIRVFLSGAYRPPRELNWLLGVALLGLVLILAFTGQLLPYNQIGYWAAHVGLEIMASVPLLGESFKRILIGGDTVGALTLSRFYVLHVVVLPLALGAFVAGHLYLLRKHGPARSPHDASNDSEPFYPRQFGRDMATISLGLVALVAVALFMGGPESRPADLSAADYVPRPEWYFLAHYELLRLTPGDFKVLATFIIPAVVGAWLVLLPWLDRGRSRALRDRPGVAFAGLVLATALIGLTGYGIAAGHLPSEPGSTDAGESPGQAAAVSASTPEIREGRRVFQRQKCRDCHQVEGRGREIGPDLSYTGARLQEGYLRAWLRDPTAFKPDTTMPPVTIGEPEFSQLVAYLMSLTASPVE